MLQSPSPIIHMTSSKSAVPVWDDIKELEMQVFCAVTQSVDGIL